MHFKVCPEYRVTSQIPLKQIYSFCFQTFCKYERSTSKGAWTALKHSCKVYYKSVYERACKILLTTTLEQLNT